MVCKIGLNQIDRKAHRTKDSLSALNEVLLRLKPSTFKDNYLASFKVCDVIVVFFLIITFIAVICDAMTLNFYTQFNSI